MKDDKKRHKSVMFGTKDKSLKRNQKKGHRDSSPVGSLSNGSSTVTVASGAPGFSISDSSNMLKLKGVSTPTSSRRSMSPSPSTTSSKKGRRKKSADVEMGIKNVEVVDANTSIHTVEVLKRPGQTLGFYIREGNGKDIKKGVFISRIAEGSIVQENGLLKIGDEIEAINSVNVTNTNLDDVVVLMSIPKKLILSIKSRRPRTASDKGKRHMYKDPQPVYVYRQESVELNCPDDLNPEDGNDSGLSSEHSLKGDARLEAEGLESPPLPFDFVPLPTPRELNLYPTPAQRSVNNNPKHSSKTLDRPGRSKTELYVSDGEHEYSSNTTDHRRHQDRKTDNLKFKQYPHLNAPDAYNSDSEVTMRTFAPQKNSLKKDRQPNQMETSHEMKHWMRKFDSMSKELTGAALTSGQSSRDGLKTLEDLQNYRTWLLESQRRLQEQGTHDLESAFAVHAMLQDSPDDLLQNNSLPRSANPNSSGSGTASTTMNPNMASTYSYLRDLPLLIRTPMKIHIDEFALYRTDHERPSTTFSETLPGGAMKARIYCGHGLKSSRTALRDLYCVIQLDGMRIAKTMIRTGAINFDWDEMFDVDILSGTTKMTCQVYHWDPKSRHQLRFTGTIQLSRIFNCLAKGSQNAKIALKMEPRGILYLELSYCRLDGSSGSPLFGRPLVETLEVEGCTVTVDSAPLIVRKCINEINQRGLNVVGLYRLCGAAKRKNQLRKEFERHPHMVDLSSDSVQDINVVTGLMKDYLRELPDALFTPEAYKMAQRGLSHKLTQTENDQDSADIIAHFIQALLPWQRGTVSELLHHLKLVAMHCDVNRMTTDNLAVCFGPILSYEASGKIEEAPAPSAKNMLSHIEVICYLLDLWPQPPNVL